MSGGRNRCVGYGEFMDRQRVIKVYMRAEENDRIRDHIRDYKGGEKRDMCYGDDKWRRRDGEIKKRGVVVESRSDSGSSDGVGLWSRRDYEREPGELSGDSGSDGCMVLDAQVKDDEINEIRGGNMSPAKVKKRKFTQVSPDEDGKEASSMLKNRESNVVSSLHPLHALEKSLEISKNGLDDGKGMSPRPRKIAKIHGSESTKSCLDGEADRAYYDTKTSYVEDEDFLTLSNIRSSRWANDFDSPDDECEIFEDGEMPNLGELKREGSTGVRSKSSDSEERVWSSGRDSCSGHVTDNIDMEEEGDHHHDGSIAASQSDTELVDAPKPCSSPRRDVNMLHGCRSVDEFERLNKINEGTYGIVYRARDKKTGEIVALKKVKMEKEREGFPLTALREINILLSFDHPSIVDVKEIVVGSSFDDIFMVMEYMEHDLKGFLDTRKQRFSESEVKSLMLQLLKGTQYLHDNWVLHRDLKTSNLLLNDELELKICDFGLARQYGSPLKPCTQLVVTLWYRAPELLLGAKQYSTAIDMWSIGCIMAELLSKGPLFNGKSELDQIDKIFRTLGSPNDSTWPGYSKLPGGRGNFVKHTNSMLRKKLPPSSFTGAPVLSDAGFDLLCKLLTYDPERRISAEAALAHDWFKEIPCSNKDLPHTLFDMLEQDRGMQRITKGPNTLEGQQWRKLQRWGSSTGGVFG